MANLEVFTRKNIRPSSGPTITLTKRGTLNLSRAAFEALQEPSAVQLLRDKDRGLIGVRATDAADDNGYAVNKNTLMINASAFTRWVGLCPDGPPPIALRWDAFMEDDALCILMTDTPTQVTSNRAKTA